MNSHVCILAQKFRAFRFFLKMSLSATLLTGETKCDAVFWICGNLLTNAARVNLDSKTLQQSVWSLLLSLWYPWEENITDGFFWYLVFKHSSWLSSRFGSTFSGIKGRSSDGSGLMKQRGYNLSAFAASLLKIHISCWTREGFLFVFLFFSSFKYTNSCLHPFYFCDSLLDDCGYSRWIN